jgi:hypothetical protein
MYIAKKAVKSPRKELSKWKIGWQRSRSPRSREGYNSSCTTLLQAITKIGTKRAMKNHRNRLRELTAHVPKHSIGTSLMQSIAKIGTQKTGTMKSSRKMLQEFSPHIPQKPSKGS